MQTQSLVVKYFVSTFVSPQRAKKKNPDCESRAFSLSFIQHTLETTALRQIQQIKHSFLLSVASCDVPLSNSADFVCLQWLVGNVVQRDDALYARMKQREIDAYDSMWDPIFVDDAALGLGDQRNKVLEVLLVKKQTIISLNQSRSEENVHFFNLFVCF